MCKAVSHSSLQGSHEAVHKPPVPADLEDFPVYPLRNALRFKVSMVQNDQWCGLGTFTEPTLL